MLYELILINEIEQRAKIIFLSVGRSEGSGMLIGDPLGERSNASSTDSELWGAEKLILQNERELRRPEGQNNFFKPPKKLFIS